MRAQNIKPKQNKETRPKTRLVGLLDNRCLITTIRFRERPCTFKVLRYLSRSEARRRKLQIHETYGRKKKIYWAECKEVD